MSSAVWASIGRTGRNRVRRKRARPSSPSAIAATATADRSPLSITARRTAAGSTPITVATASLIEFSRAPCLSSRKITARRNLCSGSVAAPSRSASSSLRRAWDPFAGGLGDLGEAGIDIGERERGSRRRVGLDAVHRGVAEADPALRQLARQIRHSDRDFPGVERTAAPPRVPPACGSSSECRGPPRTWRRARRAARSARRPIGQALQHDQMFDDGVAGLVEGGSLRSHGSRCPLSCTYTR